MRNIYFHICLGALLLTAIIASAQHTVPYTETSDIFANPERGLQKYSITNNSYNTTSGYSNINSTTLSGWRTGSDKVTVIFRYFLLSNFMSSDISATYLSNIQIDFDRIRTAGLKCIVRFSYSNAEGSSAQQPTKAQILQHIAQLAPLLETNKDIILSHQAGFIGTWGEWYYTNSTEFGTDGNINSTQWQNRKEVVDAMLSATPLNIPIQVRYPEAKKSMYGSTALTAATAYQNTANARIGFFNDAFLNEWGDMGTYSVGSAAQNPVGTADYNYLSNETKYTPMMGETNGINAPRTGGANALNELDLTNWSTLNRDYYEDNFTNWINSGHYDNILRFLGYRYVLQSSTFTKNGASLDVSISLENKGYARLFKPRQVWLVLQHVTSGNTYPFLLSSDPRTWETTVNLTETVDLSALPNGTYDTYLNMPDSDALLAERPEYSIRFANTDVWEAASGYNNLSQTVNISNTITSSQEAAESNWASIYPNPASSLVSIKMPVALAEEISIINSSGQVLKVVHPDNALYTMNISDLPSGYYMIHLVWSDKQKSIGLSVK